MVVGCNNNEAGLALACSNHDGRSLVTCNLTDAFPLAVLDGWKGSRAQLLKDSSSVAGELPLVILFIPGRLASGEIDRFKFGLSAVAAFLLSRQAGSKTVDG